MVSRLSGLGAWLLQRLSAVYLLGFLLLFTLAWAGAPDAGHEALAAALARPPLALAAALAMASLLVHAWVGVRDVILDYVHSAAWRLVALGVLATWLLSLAIWSAWILLKVTTA